MRCTFSSEPLTCRMTRKFKSYCLAIQPTPGSKSTRSSELVLGPFMAGHVECDHRHPSLFDLVRTATASAWFCDGIVSRADRDERSRTPLQFQPASTQQYLLAIARFRLLPAPTQCSSVIGGSAIEPPTPSATVIALNTEPAEAESPGGGLILVSD
jgi:hypothetical protein